ncbi:MAG TPA: ribonuclease R [Cyclobacteriaceae bacterium]|nr:ribonuclease R [Cyclobacteriaceae bacterium]
MKKKKSRSDRKVEEFSEEVMQFLKENSHKSYSLKQIVKKLHIGSKHLKISLEPMLESMVRKGSISINKHGEYKAVKRAAVITGKVDFVNPRYAFVTSEESEEDIFVRAEDLETALDDDIVKVRITGYKKDGRITGEVVEIVERFRTEFVGRLELGDNFGFVIPDFKKMYQDIYIRPSDLRGAKNNDKVIVKITEWSGPRKKPEGEIIDVLGKAGEHEAEMHSIMAEFGLPFRFTDTIEKQASKIGSVITGEEENNRKDFRDVLTFTIDPEDAKDFDDAISYRNLGNGSHEVGVHIADVTHYVRDGTLLDEEAYKRGTSVYLVDRTVPMLPEKLSNDLCSLKPNEDKLTFSAVFELDSEARATREWFGKTIIHSDRRFTYEEAQERLDSRAGDYWEELTILNELALKLRIERFRKGSINFETTEIKFKLDEKGKPLEVIPKIRKDSHKLIEDFMLLANKRVAEFIYNLHGGTERRTFVYRVHDEPDEEKLVVFENFAKRFGHSLNIKQVGISRALNNLIDDIQGKPEQNVLENLAIRSMAKAKYSTTEMGHFGLSFNHYTHFTSPIRRYPDMMVHRLLSHYLQKGKQVAREQYESKCIHCSEREKVATDAERASIKYKQVEYMKDRVGEIFDALISGVTDWGIFAEIIETKSEGMIRLSSLEDDFYVYDERNYRIIGRRNKKIFSLGDKIRVLITRVDIDRRTIDLELSENNE